jgi:hypothetical protein
MIQNAKSSDASGRKAFSGELLIKLAEQRMSQGLAPPPEIYRIEYRQLVDWLKFPDWARPIDPQLFEGCCHEG